MLSAHHELEEARGDLPQASADNNASVTSQQREDELKDAQILSTSLYGPYGDASDVPKMELPAALWTSSGGQKRLV